MRPVVQNILCSHDEDEDEDTIIDDDDDDDDDEFASRDAIKK